MSKFENKIYLKLWLRMFTPISLGGRAVKGSLYIFSWWILTITFLSLLVTDHENLWNVLLSIICFLAHVASHKLLGRLPWNCTTHCQVGFKRNDITVAILYSVWCLSFSRTAVFLILPILGYGVLAGRKFNKDFLLHYCGTLLQRNEVKDLEQKHAKAGEVCCVLFFIQGKKILVSTEGKKRF